MWWLMLVAAMAWEPNAEESAMYRALSARDPHPTCTSVEALAANPVETLTSMVQNVEMPPWVPMRAATCLVERHSEAIEPELIHWVSDTEKKGLALLVFRRLDFLPEEVEGRVIGRAQKGPFKLELNEHLLKRSQPSNR